MLRTSTRLALACALFQLTPLALAQSAPRPQPTFVRDVRFEPEASEESGRNGGRFSLLLREGRIAAVLPADAQPPPATRIVEGEGRLCLPAFVDAYARRGISEPEPDPEQDRPVPTESDVRVDMRRANRKGIRPAFRAAEALAVEEKDVEDWREAGFGTALIAPGGALLAGTSALVSVRDAAARDLVLRPDVFAHAAFTAEGGGYPTTLMGYFAQLRQFFLDSERHAALARRYADGRPGPRPPFDRELEAGAHLVDASLRLACESDSHQDAERWMRLADEFGMSLAITGGRDAWRVAQPLARRDVPVVLTLDWGKEPDDPLEDEQEEGDEPEAEPEEEEAGSAPPAAASEDPAQLPGSPDAAARGPATEATGAQDASAPGDEAEGEPGEPGPEIVWTYEEPLGVRLERRREWEERRDSALRLDEAGVRLAFGSGSEKPEKLLERVRTLVESGLAREKALAALTSEAAEILGVADRLGRIEPGYEASFTLWTEDPLRAEKARVAWIFVDGMGEELDLPDEPDELSGEAPAEGVDVSGTWELEVESQQGTRTARLELEMEEDGRVEGTITMEDPSGGGQVESEVSGRVSARRLRLESSPSFGSFTLDVVYDLEIDEDELSGEATYEIPGMDEPLVRSAEGRREPDHARRLRRDGDR